jgi:hypothetical protein
MSSKAPAAAPRHSKKLDALMSGTAVPDINAQFPFDVPAFAAPAKRWPESSRPQGSSATQKNKKRTTLSCLC